MEALFLPGKTELINLILTLLFEDTRPVGGKKQIEDTDPTTSDRKHEKNPADPPFDLKKNHQYMISQADVDRLQSLHAQLVHEINHPDKLASHLYSQGAINKMEMEDVLAKESRYKQVQELLNIVSRKSQHTFTAFTYAMCLYNQRDLAELVTNKQLEIGKSYHIYRESIHHHKVNIYHLQSHDITQASRRSWIQ